VNREPKCHPAGDRRAPHRQERQQLDCVQRDDLPRSISGKAVVRDVHEVIEIDQYARRHSEIAARAHPRRQREWDNRR
jgi:hypothetical protein